MADIQKENIDNKLKDKSQNADKKKSKFDEPEMSEEDKSLIEELDILITQLNSKTSTTVKDALEKIRDLIRSSTTSMTSVPKPLKFLRAHIDTLKKCYKEITDNEHKRFCADIVSIVGMTMGGKERDCLNYRILGSSDPLGSWGHEYIRHLTGEISQEWLLLSNEQPIENPNAMETDEKLSSVERSEKLASLIKEIIPYLMSHNAESEACDLMMEVDKLPEFVSYVEASSQPRVCLYLKSCVPYAAEPDNTILLKTTMAIYRKFDKYPDALYCAIQINDKDVIEEIFESCTDSLMKKQLAYILGRQQIFLEIDDEIEDYATLNEIISNAHYNNNFLALARELDIMEPKIPEDIYKTHLEPQRSSLGSNNIDSARQNLSASFVNGFVNTGFGKDKLLMEDGNKWLYKNKEHGMMSATASLGLVLLWDIEGGLTQIDKYLYSTDDYVKAGALLACGIVNSGVRSEIDAALALLSDYVMNSNTSIRIGAINGLALAYAGSNREDVISLLIPMFSDSKTPIEVIGMASIALGMICVGSTNLMVTHLFIETMMEYGENGKLDNTYARFLALGVGLVYLGRQELIDTIIATLRVLPDPYKSMACTLVDACAYAGTGNVLKVQSLLHICSEHYDAKDIEEKNKEIKKDSNEKPLVDLSSKQAVAVLGIALIGMGEEIGSEMCLRSFAHLLRYGEPMIRRSVPLALALLSTSSPKLQILDILSKFSHDNDHEVAHNSILAMGIVGAGTNNARLAAMLRQLAIYHSKDANNLFCVRIAQGLCHLGKGTLTLSPFYGEKLLMNPVCVGGLLTVLMSCLDVNNIILGQSHYLLFYLVSAMQPRMLVTFNSELEPLPVTVRVGQAVDVVGQAGKPKTITGFQTHSTPVLLSYGERAELATEEYLPLSDTLEGFVILKKNPDYVEFAL